MNDANQYELWAYNSETILAEKIETILRRSVGNTRPRDFYSEILRNQWEKYRREYPYARDITFEDTIKAIKDLT